MTSIDTSSNTAVALSSYDILQSLHFKHCALIVLSRGSSINNATTAQSQQQQQAAETLSLSDTFIAAGAKVPLTIVISILIKLNRIASCSLLVLVVYWLFADILQIVNCTGAKLEFCGDTCGFTDITKRSAVTMIDTLACSSSMQHRQRYYQHAICHFQKIVLCRCALRIANRLCCLRCGQAIPVMVPVPLTTVTIQLYMCSC
jgi:hypothetical protein